MSTAADVLAAIRDFAELARRRRLQGLRPEDRTTMDTLEERLRQSIDGARPAPKRLDAPSAAPGPRVAPASAARITRSAPPPTQDPVTTGSKTPPVALSAVDAEKVSAIATRDLPASRYTPPVGSLFLADYYRADLVPAKVDGTDDVTDVVDPTGTTLDLDREVRLLLGLDVAKRSSRPRRPSAGSSRSPAAVPAGETNPDPTATGPQTGAPTAARPEGSGPRSGGKVAAVIHLVTGGTVRGSLEALDPNAPTVDIVDRAGRRTPVATQDILAVFFGVRRGHPPREPAGQRLVVTLINGRGLSGCSPDYAPGAAALTLVLDPRRPNVDSVWIPAWAVRGIDYG